MNNEEIEKKLEEIIGKYLDGDDLDDLDFEDGKIIRPKNSVSSIPPICYKCDVFNYGMSADFCNCCEGPKTFF